MSNVNQIYIAFPGGGGGYWLQHLIYLLQFNQMPYESSNINFHNHEGSKNVVVNHWAKNDGNDWKIFSSEYSFNLYLQGFLKGEIYWPSWQNATFVENFNNALQQASYKFSDEWSRNYLDVIDLHYDLMFTNPVGFIEELFNLLDSKLIVYHKNPDIVTKSIEAFKKTLPDPMDYFDNMDSLLWLAWCFGIIHHEKMPGRIDYNNCTKEDLVQSILPRRDYFINYTKPYMLNIKEC